MSSQGVSAGSKRTVTYVLAVLSVLAIILAVLYFSGASFGFLNSGSHVKTGSHLLRGAVMLVVGVALGAGAWWQTKKS